MPERSEQEVYSNPLPPSLQEEEDYDDSAHPLTNDDFRKLLMTPRAPPSSSAAPAKAAPVSTKPKTTETITEEDPGEKRKKKKSYYAKLKKQEEERQKELEQKYRDRAKERREGSNRDYEQTDLISTTADYRAVAPDATAGEHYAERRKQLIQESKYLGGDMEHTHLVKGLDYALLDKVRAEISTKEIQEEEMMELAVEDHPEAVKEKEKEKEEDPEDTMVFRTKLARNIYRAMFKNKVPERNELFIPGRMAYVIDLEDEYLDSDIPTTLIRSKADCPSLESTTTLTTNDIVIKKLTQILSYLRQGRRENKKLKKKEKGKMKEEEKKMLAEVDNIYEEIGDYLPNDTRVKEKDKERDRHRDRDRERPGRDRRDRERDDRRDHRDRDRDRRDRDRDRDRHGDRDRDRRDRDRDREHERVPVRESERDRERARRDHTGGAEEPRKKSYFEKPADEDEDRVEEKGPGNARELVDSINDRFKGWGSSQMNDELGLREEDTKKEKDENIKKLKKKLEVYNSYAECYPGMMESADAIDDSDDEVDYTKMDQGNKKGPVGRWDFDTQEEYSDYMSNKEALPKAAFQYGVKMADGRKTRRTGPKDEKRQLDQEWQKIQNIIAKRKQMGTDGGQPYKMSKR